SPVNADREGSAIRIEFRCTCADRPHVSSSVGSAAELPRSLRCRSCGAERALRLERLAANGGLLGCLVCGHPELFTRKAFPAWVGLAIIAAAALLAPFTRYLSLVAAALVDFVLYRRIPAEVVWFF